MRTASLTTSPPNPSSSWPAAGAVRREDPELYRSIKPWSKIFEPDPLCAQLLDCGLSDPEAVAEPGWHPLQAPEDWWAIVLGTGYRSTVDALSLTNRERVMSASIDGVRRAGIRQIRTDVVYAKAQRSSDSPVPPCPLGAISPFVR